MAISSMGVGSGLDLGSLVTQLLAAEREPREQRLDRREAELQAKLSAYGSLRSNLITLETNLNRLALMGEGRTATSSDSGRVAVTANENATPDRYTIQVKELASAQALASQAFGDADAAVGTGTLHLQVGDGKSVDIDINAGNNSLRGIRDAINEAGAGVTASIVNDGTGARLVLSSNETGAANTISLTVTDSDGNHTDMNGLSRLAAVNMEETAAAKDAEVIINGLTVTSASNTLDNTIDGLTLDLKGTTAEGSPVTVEVGQDRDAVKSRVKDFVTAYNAIVEQINDLTRYDPETREAALMIGDSTLRGIRSNLSMGVMQGGGQPGGAFTHLVNLGVRTDETGKLTLNEQTLDRALNQDMPGVVAMLNDVTGGMRDSVAVYTERGGILDARTDGLNNGMRDVSRQRDLLENRMEQMEARLVRQFGAMDALVGQLQQTSQQLEQQMSSLNAMLGQNRRR
ncbi:flagellar hook-associated protein 2 [Thioalkalivibrio denitrificans]|uniref:Flagellar hook-associated protein 2 n=1 Tax=Thioalkalivibrio denitrificans TaxID=108003 RepID=A0A1V3ND38_9GAMM|nr:flagellar filament capping protein FliD [Thioalkalivibrio denitrificans]OOG22904.1 flagellar hook-associated protein 2 [Thioalkalivibrio denitrificans]